MNEKFEMGRKLRKLLEAALVSDAAKVPNEKHWVIMMYKTESVHVEGDERSRTHPGHGYPAHTETFHTAKHHLFRDESSFKEAMSLLYTMDPHRTDVVAFRVDGLILPKVSVSF